MRNLKRFKKLKDKFCGLPVLFLFQFSVFYHPPFNYRWMFVAGRLCKCYYVCIIDNITDIWSPGPGGTGAGVISSHGSGSGHFTDSEQSPVTQRDWTIQHQPTNKTCNVNISENHDPDPGDPPSPGSEEALTASATRHPLPSAAE